MTPHAARQTALSLIRKSASVPELGENLLAWAKDKKVPPTVVEKVAHVCNAAIVVDRQFSKDIDAKTSPEILDVPSIKQAHADAISLRKRSTTKTACAVQQVYGSVAELMQATAAGDSVKKAAQEGGEHDILDTPFECSSERLNHLLPRGVEEAGTKLAAYVDQMTASFAMTDARLGSTITKIANALNERGTPLAEVIADASQCFERDLSFHAGMVGKLVEPHLKNAACKSAGAPRNTYLVFDRHGLADDFVQAARDVVKLAALQQEIAVFSGRLIEADSLTPAPVKSAGAAAPPSRDQGARLLDDLFDAWSNQPSGDEFQRNIADRITGRGRQFEEGQSERPPERKDKPQTARNDASIFDLIGRAGERVGGLADEASNKLPNSSDDAMSRWLAPLFDNEGNRYKEKIDKSINEVDQATTVRELLALDKTIGSADPQDVINIVNSIKAVSPEVLRDRAALAFLLREAVQYNGLPMQSRSQLIKDRMELARGRAGEKDLNDRNLKNPGLPK